MGPPGIYLVGALINLELDAKENAKAIEFCVAKIISYKINYQIPGAKLQDELLYGSAGYLYCLLMAKQHLGDLYGE